MRPLARRRLRTGDDQGNTLIEVAVAAMVMAVAVTGVIGSMGAGMTLVGHSRQRSSGIQVAQERLERIHKLPFDRIAINSAEPPLPAHSTDPANPDISIGIDNTTYQVDGSTTEPLIISATGAVKHVDDPFTLGTTEFKVYQYVTWVDDADITGTQNYRRVVVVVVWKFPVHSGTRNQVVQSTIISKGAVIAPETTAQPAASGSPAPTASPTPAPTASPGACPGDNQGPNATSMDIASGAGAQQGYTNSTTLQVRLTATDACAPISALLSNDGSNFTSVTTVTSGVTATVTWTIPAGDGPKNIHARFRDGVGNVSSLSPGTIVLDKTLPTTPGNLRKVSCTTSGTNRTVTLTWDASTDANLLGYRAYKSIDSGAYNTLATIAAQSITDTDKKNYGSLKYLVRAYDRAGNESGDSNVYQFTSNSCA